MASPGDVKEWFEEKVEGLERALAIAKAIIAERARSDERVDRVLPMIGISREEYVELVVEEALDVFKNTILYTTFILMKDPMKELVAIALRCLDFVLNRDVRLFCNAGVESS